MKNSMNIVSATAGLAKIAKEHNASKLADDYRISLGFDYDKQKADKARILGCTTSLVSSSHRNNTHQLWRVVLC